MSNNIASKNFVNLAFQKNPSQTEFTITLTIESKNFIGHLPYNKTLFNEYQLWETSYKKYSEIRMESDDAQLVHNAEDSKKNLESKTEQLAKQFGESFKEWLGDTKNDNSKFGEIKKQISQWIENTNKAESENVIFIQTDDIEIQKLPWCIWDIIPIGSNVEIVFHSPISNNSDKFKGVNPFRRLKILVIQGDSTDIDTNQDIGVFKGMEEKMSNVDIQYLPDPNLESLTRQSFSKKLWDERWDVIYFCGHSGIDENGKGYITVSKNLKIKIDNLPNSIAEAVKKGLRLVIFNSCNGLGLANDCKKQGVNIPCMIVMRTVIPDRVAHQFVKLFFEQYTTNLSVYTSINKARQQLQESCTSFNAHWLPILIQSKNVLETSLLSWKAPNISLWNKVMTIGIVSILTTALICGVRHQGLLESAELNVYDQMMQARQPEEEQDKYITVIEVTDRDVDVEEKLKNERGKQSLSNDSLDKLLTKLEKYHPSVIGLDNYFDLDRVIDSKYRKLNEYLKKGELYTVCLREGDTRAELAPTNALPGSVGFSDVVLDDDGKLRRQLLGMSNNYPTKYNDCRAEQSLSYLLANNFLGRDLLQQRDRIKPGSEAKYSFLKAGKISVDLINNRMGGYQKLNDRELEYQILLNYRANTSSHNAFKTISLHDFLNEKGDEKLDNLIKNRIILIGTTDTSREPFKDKIKTPLSEKNQPKDWERYKQSDMRGIFLQAHAVSQLVNAEKNNRPLIWAFSFWIESLIILGFSIMGGIGLFTIVYIRHKVVILLVVIGAITIIVASFPISVCALSITGYWFPLLPSVTSLILTVILTSSCVGIQYIKFKLPLLTYKNSN